jgi:hypothetical protein
VLVSAAGAVSIRLDLSRYRSAVFFFNGFLASESDLKKDLKRVKMPNWKKLIIALILVSICVVVHGEQSCLKVFGYKYDQIGEKTDFSRPNRIPIYGQFSLNGIKVGQLIKVEVLLILEALLPSVSSYTFGSNPDLCI